MKAKLWEVHRECSPALVLWTPNQKCRDGVCVSLLYARSALQRAPTTLSEEPSQRRRAASSSLIANVALLLLNYISRRTARSNRCLRGGRKQQQQPPASKGSSGGGASQVRSSSLLLLAPLGRWLGAPEHSEGAPELRALRRPRAGRPRSDAAQRHHSPPARHRTSVD